MSSPEGLPLRPLRIGHLTVWPPTALAPMADLTDVCLRSIIKEQRSQAGQVAVGLVVTEFLSSRALVAGDRAVRRLLVLDESERPVAVQIYGGDPREMAAAARMAEDAGADLIDINMGCPVAKVTGRGSGAALLKDHARAQAIVAAVRLSTRLPVTVKVRAGWSQRDSNPADLARGLEEAGASMIAVHARTRADGYTGTLRPEIIGAIKAAVKVPVFGNGDLRTAQDVRRMMAQTKCDGVMIGRGALRNPKVFCEILGDQPEVSTYVHRLDLALRYGKRLMELFGPRVAYHRSRKLIGLMFRDDPEHRHVLMSLGSLGCTEDVMAFLERELAVCCTETCSRQPDRR